MVLINTNTNKAYRNLKFRYLMDVPRADCIFGSARAEDGKSYLFLVFNDKGRIYKRSGLNGAWKQVTNSAEYSEIRHIFRDIIQYERVPRYTNYASNWLNLN